MKLPKLRTPMGYPNPTTVGGPAEKKKNTKFSSGTYTQ
jgi:hypothetical protein